MRFLEQHAVLPHVMFPIPMSHVSSEFRGRTAQYARFEFQRDDGGPDVDPDQYRGRIR